MFRHQATTLRAAAFAITALLATTAAVPASAQFSVSIGYDNFHSQLAPYGTWSNHPRWGEVWHPTRAGRDFRPYYNGHWADTREYGYTWVSEDSWGDVPYHYGRWVFEPGDGWLWVPGYVWGPSWVVWRSGGGNIGWFPMPPGDNYYGDGAYRDNFDNQYGYRDWYGPSFGNDQFLSLWIFVGQDHFRDQNYRNYALPQRDYGRFISQTTNTTNYITVNNYVVNRSIDASRFARDGNQRYEAVPASSVIGRNALATRADLGRQVEQRERQQHPIPVNINPAEQRGRGNANSNAQQQNQTPQGPGNREPAKPFVEPNSQGGRGAAGLTTPPGPGTDTPRQNGRGQANVNPNEQRGRAPGSNAVVQPNPQTERVAPAANTPPNGNAVPQGQTERRNRGPANVTEPAANANVRTNPPADRGNTSFQAPQPRGAPEQNGKAIVQDNRTPPRVQGNAPAAAEGPGNAKSNQERGKGQAAPKNADDPKAAEDKKNGNDRGRN